MQRLFGPSVGLQRLVDAVNTRGADDRPAAVAAVLRNHGEPATAHAVAPLLAVLDDLDELLGEAEPARAAAALNAALSRHTGPLRLVSEPGTAWHLHAHEDDGASLADWFRASSLLALAVAFAERGAPAWGRCSASDCDDVYTLDGPGRPRTSCSPRCASRRRQAALRARRRSLPEAQRKELQP